MSKIICTAFKPFGGRKENNSEKIVMNLSSTINNTEVENEYLEVSWENTPKEIQKIFDVNPDMETLVLCGEAGGRSLISIEYVAINLMNANIVDNQGICKQNERIDSVSPDAFFSNCDCFKVVKELKQEGYEVALSLSAGSYLCNLSYFTALRIVKEKNLNTKVVFIHFPIEYKDEYVEILQKIIEKIK